MVRASRSGTASFSTRVEELAPNVVLMSLAITVILITAGIVFVLFESGSKFYTGFACGVDDFNPPQDWSSDLNSDIESHAIYADGSLSDPFYLDRFCVVDWNMDGMVQLNQPLIVFDEDENRWILSPLNDRDQWLSAYFDENPADRTPADEDGDGFPDWEQAFVPLSLLDSNENALRLQAMSFDSNRGLDRSWIDIIWIGSDEGRMLPQDYYEEDLNNDGNYDWKENRALLLIPDVSFCIERNFFSDRTSTLLNENMANIMLSYYHDRGIANTSTFEKTNQKDECLTIENSDGISEANVRYSVEGDLRDLDSNAFNQNYVKFYPDMDVQSLFEIDIENAELGESQALADEIAFPTGLSNTSQWLAWVEHVQSLLDNGSIKKIPISELPWDYDHDGNRDVGKNAYGSDVDSDIDNDGITNYKDDDLDSDGLPNYLDPDPRVPNVDVVGLLLGLMTFLVIALALTSNRFLPQLDIVTLDKYLPGINSIALVTLIIGVPSMLIPPSVPLLIVASFAFFAPAVIILAISKRISITLVCMGVTTFFFAIFPVHGVQTGHVISLGLSFVALAASCRDPRNQAGDTTKDNGRLSKLGYRFASLPGETGAFLLLATISTIILCLFDFTARVEGSIGEFLTQVWWKTDVRGVVEVTTSPDVHMGVNSLLQTTLQVAFGALFIAIPLGLGTAVYLSEYASPRTSNLIKPILELLAGIPSVVYGFFAFIVISPVVVELGEYLLARGYLAEPPQIFNPLNGAIVVGIMITPLIASLSEDALRAVPDNLRQASYALGATPTETTLRVTIPSALSGILASIILALSRAVGETMAVTLSVGTLATFSDNMFISARTMTAYIAQRVQGELPSGTTPYFSLFAVGLYLFVITLGLNLLGQRVMNRYREAYE